MRCSYEYGDGYQCVAKAPQGKRMCDEHIFLIQMAEKDKAKKAAKRQRKKIAEKPKPMPVKRAPKVVKIPKPPLYDHSAPWRCSKNGCSICSTKPTYEEYMRKRGFFHPKEFS